MTEVYRYRCSLSEIHNCGRGWILRVDGMARTNNGARVIRWRHRYWPDKNPSWTNRSEHAPLSHEISTHRLLLASGINRGFFFCRTRTHTSVHVHCCARNNVLVVVTCLIKIVSQWIKESVVIWLLVLWGVRTLFRFSLSLSLFLFIDTRPKYANHGDRRKYRKYLGYPLLTQNEVMLHASIRLSRR